MLKSDYFDAGAHVTDGTLVGILNALGQRIEASDLGTARLPATLPEGAVVRTTTPRAIWTLSLDETLVEVDALVIANGSYRWIRELGTDAAYQNVSHWYISTLGSWYADGLTPQTPTTLEELLRRLNGQLSVETIVHVMNDHPQDIAMVFQSVAYPVSISFTGRGYGTTVATGTITDYIPITPGTLGVAGERGHITASVALTSYIGKIGRVTTGDQTGAQFVILGTSTQGGVEISVPELTPYYGDPIDIDVGSEFVIEDYPKFGGMIQLFGKVDVAFDNLNVGDSGLHDITVDTRASFFNSCQLSTLDFRGGEGHQILSCYNHGSTRLNTNSTVFVFLGGGSNEGPIVVEQFSRLGIEYSVRRREIRVQNQGVASISAGAWLAVFDAANVLIVEHDSLFNGDNVGAILWSENCTGSTARVRVAGTARFRSATMPAINGTGNQYEVGTTIKTSAELVSGPGHLHANGARVVVT